MLDREQPEIVKTRAHIWKILESEVRSSLGSGR